VSPRTWTIIRHEFLATVTRKGFLFTLLFMPAWLGFVSSIGPMMEGRMRGRSDSDVRQVGVVDSAGVLAMQPGAIDTVQRDAGSRRYVATAYASVEEAQRAFDAGKIRAFLVVPEGYLDGAPASEYRQQGGLFGRASSAPWARWLRERMLLDRVDPRLVARVREPITGPTYVPDERGGFKEFHEEDEFASFLVPFGFAMLLFTTIFTAAGYLLQGLGEEKESRILESLLSSATADELMAGKLFGLGGAGLLLGLVWGTMALVAIGLLAPVFMPSVGMMAILLLYFVFGYFLIGAIALGLGSLVNSYQEATTISGLLSFMMIIPMMLGFSIMENPDTMMARVLSWFPISSPVTMSMRLASSKVPAWEVAVSLLILVAAGWLLLRVASRIFRVALLLYGKTWNLPEIMRWVRG
jgi:ABC-2 type transport system permease protein